MWLGNDGDSDNDIPNNPGLLQGARMQSYEERLLDDAGPHLEMLSITSDPALLSPTEAMEGTGKEDSGHAKADIAQASKTEDEFNRVLAQYTSAYKQFSETTLQNMESNVKGAHAGNVVDPGDGHYVYVNNHGFTHKYSTAAWDKRGKGCSATAVSIDPKELKKLKPGPPMRPGQPCGLSAELVRNKSTGEIAWVDMKGYKHVFSQDAWGNKSSSCSLDIKDIEGDEYEALPTGARMRAAQPCAKTSLDPKAWDHLQRLNARLLELADELSRQLKGLKTEDRELQAQMDTHQDQLKRYVSTLKKDQAHRPNGRPLQNAVARAESTGMLATTRWYHYWVWLVTAAVVVALTARALNTNDPGAATTLIALVALVVILYNVVRWLYERLSR